MQDAALRALRYFASFRGGDGRAWILRIVRNSAYEHLKRQSGRAEVSLGSATDHADAVGLGMDVPDPGPDPEAQGNSGLQDQKRLTSALAALPIEQRECLVLCELEQLSYKDIARITQVPIGTVMSRLSRARSASNADATLQACPMATTPVSPPSSCRSPAAEFGRCHLGMAGAVC